MHIISTLLIDRHYKIYRETTEDALKDTLSSLPHNLVDQVELHIKEETGEATIDERYEVYEQQIDMIEHVSVTCYDRDVIWRIL
jgi:hypothetical protein